MKLQLCFSTCPNDTFIFDALVHHKIDTEGLEFTVRMADVEELNLLAINSTVDVSKLSYHAYGYVANKYWLLPSGSALGRGNGPLLVSKKKVYPDEVPHLNIAIPGKYTTAALLLKLAFPGTDKLKEYLFSDIEEAVLSNETDAGVLIHEGRFTYKAKGLQLIADLGERWEQLSGQPIPLGCIAINRNLPEDIQQKFSRALRRSVEFALANPAESAAFVRKHAQEMDEEVLQKHISYFVNRYTVDLGQEGRKAIETLYTKAADLKLFPELPQQFFL